jgi:hypothetical protein
MACIRSYLGKETDDNLLSALRVFLLRRPVKPSHIGVVAGSQEIDVYEFKWNGVSCKIEIETYEGVTLVAPNTVAVEIKSIIGSL